MDYYKCDIGVYSHIHLIKYELLLDKNKLRSQKGGEGRFTNDVPKQTPVSLFSKAYLSQWHFISVYQYVQYLQDHRLFSKSRNNLNY